MITLQKHRVRTREFRGPEPGSVAILARPPGSLRAAKIIEDSKKETDYRVQCELEAREIEKAKIRGDWEMQSTKKMLQTATYRRYMSIKRDMMDNIEERREKLRQLIAKDHAELSLATDSSYETITERQAKLRERARKLKEEKALDNEQVAQQKYNQMWRDQCEELRTVLSKRTAMEIAKDNLEIIQNKESTTLQTKQFEDEYFAKLWYDDIKKKEEREKRDEEKAAERNQQQLNILIEQRAMVAEKKRKEKELIEEEQKLRLEMLELKKLEVENDYEIKLRKQKETRVGIETNVRLKMKRLERLRQEELALDTKLMEQVLSQTEAEANVASDKKKRQMEESRKYREYLRLLKQQEEQRDKELDSLMNEEISKQWQKRLDQWNRETEARQKLLQEVIAIRHEQIQDKITKNKREQEELKLEREKFAQIILENKAEDEEKRRQLVTKDRNYREDLLGQIRYNRYHSDLAEEERKREKKAMWEEEVEFKRRIDATLNADWVDPHAHPWRKIANQQSAGSRLMME